MLNKTHEAIGITSCFIAGIINLAYPLNSFFNFTTILISSMLPDIDINLGIKHRRFTHSLLFGFIISVLIIFIYPKVLLPFILGFSLHVIADMFTNTGVQVFFPIKKKIGFHLFNTNDPEESVIQYICYIIIIVFLSYQTINYLKSFFI